MLILSNTVCVCRIYKLHEPPTCQCVVITKMCKHFPFSCNISQWWSVLWRYFPCIVQHYQPLGKEDVPKCYGLIHAAYITFGRTS